MSATRRERDGSGPGEQAGRRPGRAAVEWLTAVAVLAAVAINLAGIAAIAVAQRGAADEAERLLRLQTEARAGGLESVLASTRADLAFLTGSPTFFGLESALRSRDPREVRWRRLEAEGALLIFLRGHPETARLAARSDAGTILVAATRRGGVPVLWSPGEMDDADAPGGPGAPAGPAAHQHGGSAASIIGRFEFATGVRRVSGAVALEASIDAGRLLRHDRAAGAEGRACALLDQAGALLAADPGGAALAAATDVGAGARGGDFDPSALMTAAPVRTESWSAPAPWRLVCAQRRGGAMAIVEPLSARYRFTLILNLVVMSLALLLGMFAVQQSRRRQALEAAAREEARVRDLERQLFHAERLSTAGRLAAGMAHEINNPLEGLANYLGLAHDDLARRDIPAALRHLEMAREGLRRAGDVVRQVLRHADPATAPKVVLDLNALLGQTIEFARTRPEFRSIRFERDAGAGPVEIEGSEALLGQLVLNLILNACEAQPAGGEVLVATRRDGGRAIFEIADRGPGVAAQDGERIFEPFYSTKRSTGLGLSICWSIVARHGGDLAVHDREGGGAVFRVRLPLAPARAGRKEALDA